MTDHTLRYVLVDVFAQQPFAGNQLAVVLGGDALSTYQMQAIAREFNLAETTFPVACTAEDEADGADYRVRIFTASEEIPFAGHPTLGTAWVLADRGEIEPGQRIQACGAGLVGVHVPADLGDRFELSAEPRDLSRALPDESAVRCAESVGLNAQDVVGKVFAAGCGISFVHLQVSADAVRRARPRLAAMAEVDLGGSVLRDPLIGINVYALKGSAVRSRMFAPGPSMPEDPATGSAAVGLGVALVASGHAAPDGVSSFDIEQGVELGRPSYLFGRVEAAAGAAVRCWVAGQVQPIGEGTIAVPDG